MSAIATFTKLPKAALHGLREAAVPKKKLLRAPRDDYHNYLRQHGHSAAEYEWSGFTLATLLPYLEEEHQIDLMKSEYNELSTFLTQSRDATHFIFTNAHKQAYFTKLDEQFSEEKLCNYFNEFNAADEAEAGKPMLDGIRAIHQSLNQIDEESVVVLSIV